MTTITRTTTATIIITIAAMTIPTAIIPMVTITIITTIIPIMAMDMRMIITMGMITATATALIMPTRIPIPIGD